MTADKAKIDWSFFKCKGELAKEGFIDFINKLYEINGDLLGDYKGNKEPTLISIDGIEMEIKPNNFKNQTYIRVKKFKDLLDVNGDRFIKFIGLTNNKVLIASIVTFDCGIVEIDLNNYNSFVSGRNDLYHQIKQLNGEVLSPYINKEEIIKVRIDDAHFETIPNRFKNSILKSINNFKTSIEGEDVFIKFIEYSEVGLVAELETVDMFDNKGRFNVAVGYYKKFITSRKSTYENIIKKNYKAKSIYNGDKTYMLIDFNCGHKPKLIKPNCIKNDVGCKSCNESKGEKKTIEILDKYNIEYETQYIGFRELKGVNGGNLKPDFYIPSINTVIEINGEGHYEGSMFSDESNTIEHDKIKRKYFEENNMNLVEIPYLTRGKNRNKALKHIEDTVLKLLKDNKLI